MASPSIILCILSNEQQEEYAEEFVSIQAPGLDFIFEDDPEDALERIPEIGPAVVVVGMEVGPMEGLELLYEIRQQHAGFDRPVVVLPNKSDPFPPVIHTQDASTGRSKADQVDFAAIVSLLEEQVAPAEPEAPPPAATPTPAPEEVAAPAASPAPAPAASPAPAPAASPAPAPAASPAPAPAAAPPEAAAPSAKPAISTERPLPPPMATPVAPAKSGSSKAPIVIVVVVVFLVLAGVGGFVFLSGNGADDDGAGTGGPEDPGTGAPDPGASPGPDLGLAAQAPDAAASPGEEPAAPDPTPGAGEGDPLMAELERGMDLPYSFRSGSTHPTVLDEGQLRGLVELLGRHPDVRVELIGHTSGDGREQINEELGLERAREVRDHLRTLGLDRSRVTITSLGADDPSISNETAEGRSRNRRVQAKLLR